MTITEASATATIKINDIGMSFGQEYYTVLSREPSRLHLFYTKVSTLLHGEEGDLDAPIAMGVEAIQACMLKSAFAGSRFIIHNIDCHPSLNGGILVNVLGQMQAKGERTSSRTFAQTFFLAEQPSGYFILNDNLRFLADRPVSTSTTTTAATAAPSVSAQVKAEPEPVKPEAKPQPAVEPVQSTPEPMIETPVPAAAAPTTGTSDASSSSAAKPPKKIVSSAASKKAAAAAAAAAAPVKESAVDEIPESGPSSWAQLAAVQANKWATGVVSAAKGTSIPSANTNGASSNTNTATRRPAQQFPNQTKPIINGGSPSTAPKQLPFVPEAALYVTGVTDKIKADAIRQEFAALGALAHFDINFNRGCAFIEYVDPAVAKILLEAGSLTVNGIVLTIGKRRVINNKDGARVPANKDPKKFTTAGRDRRSTATVNNSALSTPSA